MKKFLAHIFFILPLILLINCGESEQPAPTPVEVSFRSKFINIPETKTAESVLIQFDSPATFDGEIKISVTEYNAQYNENFVTQPSTDNTIISVPFRLGSNQASLVIAPIIDSDNSVDSLRLTIEQNEDIILGSEVTATVYLTESSTEGGGGNNSGSGACGQTVYATGTVQCSPGFSPNSLDIVTWNIENFPMTSNSIASVIDIIRDFNADIYAIQEIDDVNAFNMVVSSLNGYEGVFADVRGGIELGFIYKTSEITSISSPIQLFEGQTSPFPREPVEVDIRHSNGLEIKLINLHLKCCNDGISRRANASEILKTYLDDNFDDEEVIVLGDWNEDLVNGSNSFSNFLDDVDNYIFADLPINEGSSEDFSYQLFNPRSHLDHILVTNELCDNILNSYTARLDDCVTGYFSEVSDHRPVTVSLAAD